MMGSVRVGLVSCSRSGRFSVMYLLVDQEDVGTMTGQRVTIRHYFKWKGRYTTYTTFQLLMNQIKFGIMSGGPVMRSVFVFGVDAYHEFGNPLVGLYDICGGVGQHVITKAVLIEIILCNGEVVVPNRVVGPVAMPKVGDQDCDVVLESRIVCCQCPIVIILQSFDFSPA